MAARDAEVPPARGRAGSRAGGQRRHSRTLGTAAGSGAPGAGVPGGGAVYGRAASPPPEPRAQGRPPRGADDAEDLVEVFVGLYRREWKAPALDLRPLYDSPQLLLAQERYFAGLPDATERALILLRRWLARYCGDRAEQNALALGRGSDLRQARVASRILMQRLRRPDLTRLEEAVVVGRALGLALDASAHRRAVDAMFASLRRYGPDLLRDLAWKTPERWRQYEARYGVAADDPSVPG